VTKLPKMLGWQNNVPLILSLSSVALYVYYCSAYFPVTCRAAAADAMIHQ